MNEEEVLKKRRVRRRTYRRWHTMANFTAEYKRRLKQAKLEGERIMAKYSNVAASKLVELTQSKKEEIARKASLDVINHFQPQDQGQKRRQRGTRRGEATRFVAGKSEQTACGACGRRQIKIDKGRYVKGPINGGRHMLI